METCNLTNIPYSVLEQSDNVMQECIKCGGSFFNEKDHTCPPNWKCWVEEDGKVVGAVTNVLSYDAVDAVTDFVEKYGSQFLGECCDRSEFQFKIVATVASMDNKEHRFEIVGEMNPIFSAYNIQSQTNDFCVTRKIF